VTTRRAIPVSLIAVSLAAALAGCARQRPNAKLVLEPISADRRWVSAEHRDHALVGRIWDERAQDFVTEDALVRALAEADFALLGEIHDNPDHHVIQARLVRAIAAGGKRPALAFEMMGADKQDAIDAALAKRPRSPDAVARAVEWDRSGWFGFAMYRPVFAAGLDAGMAIVAANLPVADAKRVAKEGAEALSPELRGVLARQEPLPADVVASLRAEMKASHCDAPLPEPFLDRLALAQRARDAQMASRVTAGGGSGGGILITGNGHVRTDRGVPSYLARDDGTRRMVAVGLFEVLPERTTPAQYAEEYGSARLPFDFVVFTPRTQREDPCAALRGHDWSHGKTGAPKTATEEKPAATPPR
jgi:uncharacterized iron-regulated protein